MVMPKLPTMNSTDLMRDFATFNHSLRNYEAVEEDGADEENIIPHNLVNVHLGEECRYSNAACEPRKTESSVAKAQII